MHAEDDRQALLRLRLELLHQIRLHGAEHAVEADEIDAIHGLSVETRVNRVRSLEERPAALLERLLPRLLLAGEVGVELVVAHRAEHRAAVVLLNEIEVRLTLPVDQVARVEHVVHVVLRPRERVAQRLLLASAERARAPLLRPELAGGVRLVRIRLGEMRVRDMEDRERRRRASRDVLVGELQTLEPAAFGEHGGVGRERREPRHGHEAADARQEVSTRDIHGKIG